MMFRIIQYIAYALLWLISLLPLWALYRISDLLYVINKYLIRYRYKVIDKNLLNAFPEKSIEERSQIIKDFYRHFFDFIVEVIKMMNIRKATLEKRCIFKNADLVNTLCEKGKSLTMVSGHYANWEWMCYLPLKITCPALAIYHPLMNTFSNNIIYKLRSKFGVQPIAMDDIYKEIVNRMRINEPFLTYYLSDQRPPSNTKYWTNFLNQDTGFYLGIEKISRKYDFAVVFVDIVKIRRGYYEITFKTLFESTKNTKEFEVSDAHVRVLEERIHQAPQYWLWSHNRWRDKRTTTQANIQ